MTLLDRRKFIALTGLSLLGITAATVYSAFGKSRRQATRYRMYIGTYTGGRKDGIFLYELNPSGELKLLGSTEAEDPSFLAIHPDGNYLYAVNEIGEYEGSKSGSVSAFAIEKPSGKLRFINKQASRGASPCYISTDATGRQVLVANYMGGNVAVLPVQGANGLGPASDTKQHQGSGPNQERQEAPHAHAIVMAPGNQYALAADLGTDKIMIYKLDVQQGKLQPASTPYTQTQAGAGPRHIAFSGDRVFVINELDSTLNAYAWNADRGTLTLQQTIAMLPQGYTGKNQCADVHVSPDGRYVYGSNRGHNSIAVFAIEQGTGNLKLVEHVSTRGDWPRNFTLTPDGNLLLVANERSDAVVSFRVNKQTGKLTPTGHITQVPKPVCLMLMPS